MYKVPQDKVKFEQIMLEKNLDKRYKKLSDFMLNVEVGSCFWNKAREESRRLENYGITF